MKASVKFIAGAVVALAGILTTALPLQGQVADDNQNRRRSPIVRAVEVISPSVVNINTQKLARRRSAVFDMFDYGETTRTPGKGRYQNYSLGSGVIIDEKGYVVTNDHVVQRADRITVSLHDGREVPATLIGSDVQNDIAILKVHSKTPLPAARLARSNDVMLGETTVAVGNPFGLGGSVTAGIVSAVNRTVSFRNKKIFKDFIQTSAVINPGNSGGPLINITGDVIGINVAIHSRGPGIGFAIPISRVREVVYSVLDPRLTKEAILGIDIDHRHEGDGAIVRTVDRGTPASQTGLKSGDKIITVNGQRIEDWIDFQTTVQELEIGDRVKLGYVGGGRRKQADLVLTKAPPTQEERGLFALCGFEFDDLPAQRPAALRNLRGVVVTAVPKGSGAEAVGIQPGDIIYSLASNSVTGKDMAFRILQRFSRHRQVPIHLYRPGEDAHYGGDLPFKK